MSISAKSARRLPLVWNKRHSHGRLRRMGFLTSSSLTSKPDTVVTKELRGNARWSNPAKTYDLTAEGKKQFQVQKGLFGGVSGFCAVKYSVVSINNFTPPQNAMGQTISQVNYTPAAEVRPWTRNAAVQAAFGNNVVAHTEPRVETLLQTERGWIDARDFGNSPGL